MLVQKDKRHGDGVLTLDNGESFSGKFDNGRPLEGMFELLTEEVGC